MGKRFVGAIFCLIASILFSTSYIVAAIYGGVGNAMFFNDGLSLVGSNLFPLSFLSLVCGIGYLVWAEISEKNKK